MIPELGRSPAEGSGYPLQYSGLENTMDCIVHGVTRSWTRPGDFHKKRQEWTCCLQARKSALIRKPPRDTLTVDFFPASRIKRKHVSIVQAAWFVIFLLWRPEKTNSGPIVWDQTQLGWNSDSSTLLVDLGQVISFF